MSPLHRFSWARRVVVNTSTPGKVSESISISHNKYVIRTFLGASYMDACSFEQYAVNSSCSEALMLGTTTPHEPWDFFWCPILINIIDWPCLTLQQKNKTKYTNSHLHFRLLIQSRDFIIGPFELKLSTTKGGDCNHSGQVFNPVPPMPNMYIKYYKYVIYLIYIYTYVHIYIYPEETLEVIWDGRDKMIILWKDQWRRAGPPFSHFRRAERCVWFG
jgi:hypothetical protein